MVRLFFGPKGLDLEGERDRQAELRRRTRYELALEGRQARKRARDRLCCTTPRAAVVGRRTTTQHPSRETTRPDAGRVAGRPKT